MRDVFIAQLIQSACRTNRFGGRGARHPTGTDSSSLASQDSRTRRFVIGYLRRWTLRLNQAKKKLQLWNHRVREEMIAKFWWCRLLARKSGSVATSCR